MIHKLPSSDPGTMLVRFELPAAIWADSVHLVGDFNGWNRHSHAMERDRSDGTWYIVLRLERGREFQFRYLVNDSEWHNDWNADRYVTNPYGGTNSVVSTITPESQDDPVEQIT
jgi:1,4-alpha-glucan branching enzyme